MAELPTKVMSAVACALAGAALAVSLIHHGPAGPPGARGPRGSAGAQGNAGKSAAESRLGVCWEASNFTQTWADGSSSNWVSSVTIDQPQLSNGVYVCPQGETFVSIVPQTG